MDPLRLILRWIRGWAQRRKLVTVEWEDVVTEVRKKNRWFVAVLLYGNYPEWNVRLSLEGSAAYARSSLGSAPVEVRLAQILEVKPDKFNPERSRAICTYRKMGECAECGLESYVGCALRVHSAGIETLGLCSDCGETFFAQDDRSLELGNIMPTSFLGWNEPLVGRRKVGSARG